MVTAEIDITDIDKWIRQEKGIICRSIEIKLDKDNFVRFLKKEIDSEFICMGIDFFKAGLEKQTNKKERFKFYVELIKDDIPYCEVNQKFFTEQIQKFIEDKIENIKMGN